VKVYSTSCYRVEAMVLAVLLSHCSSTPKNWTSDDVFERSDLKVKAQEQWTHSLKGVAADLVMAKESGSVVVSEVAHPERGGVPQIHWWNAAGKQVVPSFQAASHVRSLALSPQGSMLFIQLSSADLLAFSTSGGRGAVWQLADMPCRPVAFTEESLVCVYDDEVKPGTQLDFIDSRKGVKVRTYRNTRELLEYRYLKESKLIVLGLSGGLIQVISTTTGKTVSEKSLDSEVLGLAGRERAGGEVELAVLTLKRDRGRRLEVFRLPEFKVVRTFPVARPLEQVESVGAESWGLFGNAPLGQEVLVFSNLTGAEAWSKRIRRYADFSQPMSTGRHGLWVGLEEVVSERRRNRLALLDEQGKLRANLVFDPQDGAYYYAYQYSDQANMIVTVDEAAMVRAFKLKE